MNAGERQALALGYVVAERERQEALFPNRSEGKGTCANPEMDPLFALGILAEEFGEVARAVLEHDEDNLFEELIQVAAVACAWVEAMLERSDAVHH